MTQTFAEAAKRTYFLLARGLGLVKIGHSCLPINRMLILRNLNAAELIPVLVFDYPEAEVHERFAKLRHHGEWFQNEPEIADWLEEIGEEHAASMLRKGEWSDRDNG